MVSAGSTSTPRVGVRTRVTIRKGDSLVVRRVISLAWLLGLVFTLGMVQTDRLLAQEVKKATNDDGTEAGSNQARGTQARSTQEGRGQEGRGRQERAREGRGSPSSDRSQGGRREAGKGPPRRGRGDRGRAGRRPGRNLDRPAADPGHPDQGLCDRCADAQEPGRQEDVLGGHAGGLLRRGSRATASSKA